MMRKFFLGILFCLIGCIQSSDALVQRSNKAMQSGERSLVVIVPSYKNEQWYKRNLDSIFNQKYSNYRVVYIDDCSPDNTYDCVKAYIEKHGVGNKIRLIRNKKNRGALANLYTEIHACKDHEIILTLDGDDWLHGDMVFAKINEAYADGTTLMTYGQYKHVPGGKLGMCRWPDKRVIQNKSYRKNSWVSSHLRTFRAGLFKQVKLKDLMYEGDFFDVTWDMAFMFPMLEMASPLSPQGLPRFKCITDVLYEYNVINPLSDFRKKLRRQQSCEKVVRGKRKYPTIKTVQEAPSNYLVSVVIVSDNKPKNLFVLLETLERSVSGAGDVTVLYQAQNKITDVSYQRVHESFPEVRFVSLTIERAQDILHQAVVSTRHDYILLARDGMAIIGPLDLGRCAQLLHKTKAHGFYIGFYDQDSAPRATCIELEDAIFAWQFKDGLESWRMSSAADVGLYKKSDIVDCVCPCSDAVGLFFKQQKVFMWEPGKRDNVDFVLLREKLRGNK